MDYTNKTIRKPFVESFHGYFDISSIQKDNINKINDPKSLKSRLSEPLKLFSKQQLKTNKSFEAPICKRKINGVNVKPIKKVPTNPLKSKADINPQLINTTDKAIIGSKNKIVNIKEQSKIKINKVDIKDDIKISNILITPKLDKIKVINLMNGAECFESSLESLNSLHIVESQANEYKFGSFFENDQQNDIDLNIVTNEILNITEPTNTILYCTDDDGTNDIVSSSPSKLASSSISSLHPTSSSPNSAFVFSSKTQYSNKTKPTIDILAAANYANLQDLSFLTYAKDVSKSNNSLTCPPLFLLMEGHDKVAENNSIDHNTEDINNVSKNISSKTKLSFNRPRSTSFISPENEKSASDFHLQLKNTDDRISRLADTKNHDKLIDNCLNRPFSEIYSNKLGQNSSKLDTLNMTASRTLSASSGYFSACVSTCLDNQSVASINNIYNNKISKDEINKMNQIQNILTIDSDRNAIKEDNFNNEYFLSNLSNTSTSSLNVSEQIQLARSCSQINSNLTTASRKNNSLAYQQKNSDSNTILPTDIININLANNTHLKHNEKTNIEMESLKQELKLTKESCSSLKIQLQVNNLIVHTCEQNIESLTTRLKQLTLILEMKENEIAKLKSNLNDKKEKSTDCDSALIPLHCVHG